MLVQDRYKRFNALFPVQVLNLPSLRKGFRKDSRAATECYAVMYAVIFVVAPTYWTQYLVCLGNTDIQNKTKVDVTFTSFLLICIHTCMTGLCVKWFPSFQAKSS